jgi:anti-anti-sigma factor
VELKRLQGGILVAALHTVDQLNTRLGGIMLKVHAKKLDAVEVLGLEGQIVNGDTEILRSAVQSASDSSDIILDLQNVKIVDAHGLGVLLQLREQALAKGTHFKLINMSKPLYRIFEITRLNTVFEISPDVKFFPQVACSQRLPVAA